MLALNLVAGEEETGNVSEIFGEGISLVCSCSPKANKCFAAREMAQWLYGWCCRAVTKRSYRALSARTGKSLCPPTSEEKGILPAEGRALGRSREDLLCDKNEQTGSLVSEKTCNRKMTA